MIIDVASSSHDPLFPLPFSIAIVIVTLVIEWQMWKRGGFYRLAARRGPRTRLAAIIASACVFCFGAFLAASQVVPAIASWVVGALVTIPLLLAILRKPIPKEPQDPANGPEFGADGSRIR